MTLNIFWPGAIYIATLKTIAIKETTDTFPYIIAPKKIALSKHNKMKNLLNVFKYLR